MEPARFATRARLEGERYGADPWVFVRELLQNSRDAGARWVRLEAVRVGGVDRVRCRDDGEGMSLGHARRYLFRLYASSKVERKGLAGSFGVGFWSLLRFAPERIVIRSRPPGGQGWQARLSGDLERLEIEGWDGSPGTEIVLERAARGAAPGDEVRRVVRRDARFLRRRGSLDEPLEVWVNGSRTAEKLTLPPPCALLRGRGWRGCVALGSEPLVEVMAFGLRVRSAATLDDLLLTGRSPDTATSGLQPRVLLDSDRLGVLLARSDARQDRELEKLVRRARREIDRLLGRELDRHLPTSRLGRLRAVVVGIFAHGRRAGAAAVLLGAVVGVGFLVGEAGRLRRTADDGGADPRRVPAAHGVPAEPNLRPFDGMTAYRGPGALSGSSAGAVAVSYRPAEARPHLAVLRLDGLDRYGRTVSASGPLRRYPSRPCTRGCFEIEATLAPTGGLLRIPVPTGHLVDAGSARIDGRQVAVWLTERGEAAIELDVPGEKLWYRTGPGGAAPAGGGEWPPLPGSLAAIAQDLEALPVAEAVELAVPAVAELVAYDRGVVHGPGDDFLERCLAAGAGDCDVQNAVLAAVLDGAGVSVRLAVGWMGADGRVRPGAHAWVEWWDGETGVWAVADASVAAPMDEPGDGGAKAAQASPSTRWWRPWAVVSAAIAALLIWRLATRTRRRFLAGQGLEAMGPELVRTVAARSDNPRPGDPLLYRRIIPCVGSGPISVASAVRLAGKGRLLSARRDGWVAQAARRRGSRVVDLSSAEGAAAGAKLPAIAVDRWQESAPLDAGLPSRWRAVADRPDGEVAAFVLSGGRLRRSICLVSVPEGHGLLNMPARDRPLAALAAAVRSGCEVPPVWIRNAARRAIDEAGDE